MMDGVEIWRPISGYEGFYEVSSLGNVRGLSRMDCAGRSRPTKIKAPHSNKRGYRSVTLYRHDKSHGFLIARLVLTAFVGSCPAGMEAAHDNGNSSDDRVDNLRWDTHSGNCADKRVHGTQQNQMGEHAPTAKLSERDVRRAFAMHRAGTPQKDIAVELGVGRPQISTILSGKSWGHLGLSQR